MAQVEIDEAELVSLKNVAGLFAKTLNSKERNSMLQAVKRANPDLPIPEIDARAPIDEAMNGFRDELKATRDELAAERQARKDENDRAKLAQQWNEGRSKAQKQGYVGESLDALEKFMEEKGVADHEVAAAAFEKLHPQQAQPVVNPSGKFDFFGMPNADDKIGKAIVDLRDGKTDENSFLDFSVNEVLREMRGAA
jgi:hypothetical protein